MSYAIKIYVFMLISFLHRFHGNFLLNIARVMTKRGGGSSLHVDEIKPLFCYYAYASPKVDQKRKGNQSAHIITLMFHAEWAAERCICLFVINFKKAT